jgi:hypothetical protein
MKGAVRALILGAMVQAAVAQTGVTQIKLWTDPMGARVRPLEGIVVQVRAYGQIRNDSGETQIVRLNRGGATLKIKEDEPVSTETAPVRLQVEGEPDTAASPAEPEPIHLAVEGDHGWVSKPFRFQGTDTETFYQEGLSQIGSIFSSITKEYVLQDAFLYTAPETPGKYELDAELEGATTWIEIEVTPEAPSTKEPEKFSFPPEDRSGQPYRALAEHWAPVLAQETWFTPKADFPARFDFDGNWRGNDNWNDLGEGSSQAYVHFAAMETATHWFLIYNVFHPRDYSDKCVIGTCHENDNEGLILTIRRDG